uniref:UDP-GlcNAc:betaGal beta-1,3-N-acetylglucosaminyltransferase-like protein 1 n=1 Tax=Neovison vison TaxID=452646 RepID=A0A8C7EXP5_NEOVI
MPTWFCSRAWFSHVGPFDEGGRGVPEDLLFFYDHLRKGGGVVRVDQSLLLYRYLPDAATHSVLETTIWTHRVCFLEERVLPRWAAFTIWNAGRQGRRLYRSLTAEARRKVVAFCDVDENKIRKGFYCHEDSQVCGPSAPGRRASSHMGCPHQPSSDWGMWSSRCPEPSSLGKATRPSGGGPTAGDLRTQNGLCPCLAQVCLLCTSELGRGEGSVQVPCPRAGPAWTPAHKTSCSQERPKPRVPILHFRAARPPFVICVKLDLTGGAFENNLRSLHLREGQDFLHFS